MKRRIYIGDIHMTSAVSHSPGGGMKPWAWLDPPRAAALAGFLRSERLREFDELVLLGDVFDQWLYPFDVKPPSLREIVDAPQNAPIRDAFRALASAGFPVTYLRGNHDLSVTEAELADVMPGWRWIPGVLSEPGLRVSHGHEGALFNGPEPRGKPLPFGYFITRIVAHATAHGVVKPGFNLTTLLGSVDEVLALASGQTSLGAAVFDRCFEMVAKVPGVSLATSLAMPDGGALTLGEVKQVFSSLWQDWKAHCGDPRVALETEFDPWNVLPSTPRLVHINGHKHDRTWNYDEGLQRVYLRPGAICDAEKVDDKTDRYRWHYVTTEQDGHAIVAHLCHWPQGPMTTSPAIVHG